MPTITTTVTSAQASGVTTTVTTTEATPAEAVAVAAPPQAEKAAIETAYGEVVTTGLIFGEGPRFHNGKFYCVDMCGYHPDTGHETSTNGPLGDHGFIWECDFSTTPATKKRYACFTDCPPSGLGWLPDGRMLAVATYAMELRVETEPGSAVFVKHCDISPGAAEADDFLNDMVVAADGTAYVGIEFNFTNPDRHASPIRDLAMVTPSGELKMQSGSQCAFPNGCVITPDGKTFIVGETFGGQLSAFDIGADGSLSNKRQWADTKAAFDKRFPGQFSEASMAFADGICMDAEGGIWSAVPCTEFPSENWSGGCVRYNKEGEITHHFGFDTSLTFGCTVAVMLDDECNLYCVTGKEVGGHAPCGRNNAMIVKVKAPFPAARSPTNPNYCGGYC